jgi:hypothetical protein
MVVVGDPQGVVERPTCGGPDFLLEVGKDDVQATSVTDGESGLDELRGERMPEPEADRPFNDHAGAECLVEEGTQPGIASNYEACVRENSVQC